MNKLLVVNSTFSIKEVSQPLKDKLSIKDFNYLYISEKSDFDMLLDNIESYPIMDTFKVVVFDISLFTNPELKKLISVINRCKFINAVGFYYLKDKIDKLDKKISSLFEKNNFKVENKCGINLQTVKTILSNYKLNIDPNTFINHDNMDVVINDINKIKYLGPEELSGAKVKKYLSDSYETNVFELIDVVLKGNADLALKKLSLVLGASNSYAVNSSMLKHFSLLRSVKQFSSNEDISTSQVLNGSSAYVHPYRLSLLKKSIVKIDLNFAIEELLNNSITKKMDLEMSILKIVSKKN